VQPTRLTLTSNEVDQASRRRWGRLMAPVWPPAATQLRCADRQSPGS
jgi:hypothetical protein